MVKHEQELITIAYMPASKNAKAEAWLPEPAEASEINPPIVLMTATLEQFQKANTNAIDACFYRTEGRVLGTVNEQFKRLLIDAVYCLESEAFTADVHREGMAKKIRHELGLPPVE